MSRGRPEGRAHRQRLRKEVLPSLRVGCRVPPSKLIAKLLGISQQEASRHLRRVLEEDGFVVEMQADREIGGRRLHVTALQEERLIRVDAIAAQRMAAAPIHAFEIPLSGYLKAAMIRPSRWDGLTNYPTKDTHCADCGHGVWRRTATGCGCSSCVPAEIRGRAAA